MTPNVPLDEVFKHPEFKSSDLEGQLGFIDQWYSHREQGEDDQTRASLNFNRSMIRSAHEMRWTKDNDTPARSEYASKMLGAYGKLADATKDSPFNDPYAISLPQAKNLVDKEPSYTLEPSTQSKVQRARALIEFNRDAAKAGRDLEIYYRRSNNLMSFAPDILQERKQMEDLKRASNVSARGMPVVKASAFDKSEVERNLLQNTKFKEEDIEAAVADYGRATRTDANGAADTHFDVLSTGEVVFTPEGALFPEDTKARLEASQIPLGAKKRAIARLKDESTERAQALYNQMAASGTLKKDMDATIASMGGDLLPGMQQMFRDAKADPFISSTISGVSKGLYDVAGIVPSIASAVTAGVVGEDTRAYMAKQGRGWSAAGSMTAGTGGANATALQFTHGLSAAVPQILVQLGAAKGAQGLAAAGNRLATAEGAANIGFNTSIGLAGAQSFSSTFNSALAEGKDRVDATLQGMVSGTITALTTAGFGRTGVESIFSNPAARQGVKEYFGSILVNAGAEGVEEFTDEFFNGMVAAAAFGDKRGQTEIVRDALMAGSIGFAMGGGTRTLQGRGKNADNPFDPPDSAPQETPKPDLAPVPVFQYDFDSEQVPTTEGAPADNLNRITQAGTEEAPEFEVHPAHNQKPFASREEAETYVRNRNWIAFQDKIVSKFGDIQNPEIKTAVEAIRRVGEGLARSGINPDTDFFANFITEEDVTDALAEQEATQETTSEQANVNDTPTDESEAPQQEVSEEPQPEEQEASPVAEEEAPAAPVEGQKGDGAPGKRGSIRTTPDLAGIVGANKVLVSGFKSGDPTTLLHETFHGLQLIKAADGRPMLDHAMGPDIDKFNKWTTRGGKIAPDSVEALERAAVGFEHYLATGKAPAKQLQPLFAKLANIFKSVYTGIRDIVMATPQEKGGQVPLTPEAIASYDRLFTGIRPDGTAVPQATGTPMGPQPESSPLKAAAADPRFTLGNTGAVMVPTAKGEPQKGFRTFGRASGFRNTVAAKMGIPASALQIDKFGEEGRYFVYAHPVAAPKLFGLTPTGNTAEAVTLDSPAVPALQSLVEGAAMSPGAVVRVDGRQAGVRDPRQIRIEFTPAGREMAIAAALDTGLPVHEIGEPVATGDFGAQSDGSFIGPFTTYRMRNPVPWREMSRIAARAGIENFFYDDHAGVVTLYQGTFRSGLEEAIEAKLPNSATPAQALAIARTAKAEEVKWSGVENAIETIAAENGGKVPKDKLLDFLKANALHFEEVTLQSGSWVFNRNFETEAELQEHIDGDTALTDRDGNLQKGLDIRQDENGFWNIWDTDEGDQTLYKNYKTEGGTNYREVILTKPEKPRATTIEQALEEWKKDARQGKRGRYTPEEIETMDPDNIFAILRDEYMHPRGKSEFTDPHFNDVPNYIAHSRLQDFETEAATRPMVEIEADVMEVVPNLKSVGSGLTTSLVRSGTLTPEEAGAFDRKYGLWSSPYFSVGVEQGTLIEEIQSGRHQEGRKKGYREDDRKQEKAERLKELQPRLDVLNKKFINNDLTDEELLERASLLEEKTIIQHFLQRVTARGENAPGTPDAPFRKDWPLQMFKRALRDAVSTGKQWIGWTTGETQADRFDISKQVESIYIARKADGFHITAEQKAGGEDFNVGSGIPPEKVADYIGKEAAEKAGVSTMEVGGYSFLENQDLKIGGQGMRGFYDVMLPTEVGKFVKKMGGKVDKSSVVVQKGRPVANPTPEGKIRVDQHQEIWRVDITPEMREQAQKGFMLFQSSIEQKEQALTRELNESGTVPSKPAREARRIRAHYPDPANPAERAAFGEGSNSLTRAETAALRQARGFAGAMNPSHRSDPVVAEAYRALANELPGVPLVPRPDAKENEDFARGIAAGLRTGPARWAAVSTLRGGKATGQAIPGLLPVHLAATGNPAVDASLNEMAVRLRNSSRGDYVVAGSIAGANDLKAREAMPKDPESRAQIDLAQSERFSRELDRIKVLDQIDVPQLLPHDTEKNVSSKPTGIAAFFWTPIAKMMGGTKFSPWKQVQQALGNNPLAPVIGTWWRYRDIAKRASHKVSREMFNKHGDVWQIDPVTGGIKNFTGPVSPAWSSHYVDVFEAEFETPGTYPLTPQQRAWITDARQVIQDSVRQMLSNGIPMAVFLDSSGNIDYAKLASNYYFPRRVVGSIDLSDNKALSDRTNRNGSSMAPRNKRGFDRSRKYDTAFEGANDGVIYDPDPLSALEGFVRDTFSKIGDWRTIHDPDVAGVAGPASLKRGERTVKIGDIQAVFDEPTAQELEAWTTDKLKQWDALKIFKDGLGIIRTLKLGIDFSAPVVQGAVITATRPLRAARAIVAAMKSFATPNGGRDFFIKRADHIKEYVEAGGALGAALDFVEVAMSVGEQLRLKSSRAGRVFDATIGRFSRYHQTFMDAAAIEFWASLRRHALDPSTGALDPQRAREVALQCDRLVGREAIGAYGLSGNGQNMMALVATAPSMYIAYGNIIGSMFSKNPTEAKIAWQEAARFSTATALWFIGSALMAGMEWPEIEERLKPWNSKFLTVRSRMPWSDDYYEFGVGGFFRSVTRMLGQLSHTAFDNRNNTVDDVLGPLQAFAGSRVAPGVSMLLSLWRGEDHFGTPRDRARLVVEGIAPIAFTDVATAGAEKIANLFGVHGQFMTEEERAFMDSTPQSMLIQVVGLNAYPVAKRTQWYLEAKQHSQELFGKEYKELSAVERIVVVETVTALKGAPPSLDSFDLDDFLRKKSARVAEYLDGDTSKILSEAGLLEKGIPGPQAYRTSRNVAVPMETEEQIAMEKSYAKNLQTFLKPLAQLKGILPEEAYEKLIRQAVTNSEKVSMMEAGWPR